MKQVKRLLLLLCIVMAGAGNARAYTPEYVRLYDVTYALYTNFLGLDLAYVTGYLGTEKTVTIPATITYGGTTYTVTGLREGTNWNPDAASQCISNNYVEQIVFESTDLTINVGSSYTDPVFYLPNLRISISRTQPPICHVPTASCLLARLSIPLPPIFTGRHVWSWLR